MGSLIIGELITLPSRIIASVLPIFSFVAFPNRFEPSLSKVKVTIVSLFLLSILGCASIKFSPLRITLLLTFSWLLSSSLYKDSTPNSED